MALVNRWYQILQLLVTHKEMTVTELQNKLAASPQTVRKSIETLNDELLGIAQIVQHKNEFQITIADFDQFDQGLFQMGLRNALIQRAHCAHGLWSGGKEVQPRGRLRGGRDGRVHGVSTCR